MTIKNQPHREAKGTGNNRQTDKARSIQTKTHNQPFSGNGKCTGKYRGTPNYGNTK